MSKKSSRFGPVVADLDAHLAVFVATLAKAGYSEKTQHDKERLITPFIRWVREVGIAIADFDEACVDAFLACPSRRRYNHRTALQQFLDHLRLVDALPRHHLEQSPAEVLFQRYVEYLRDTQGLSPHSIDVYSQFVRTFIEAQRLPESIAALDALAVRRYLLDHSLGRSVSFTRLLAAALRSFLRFCFLDGTTATNLSTAVPPVRRWQHAPIPAFLTAEEVERVIATTDGSTPARGLRNRAILLLLARLGLRAGEVVALELDDLCWATGEIVVRGKGRLLDRMPLLNEVGEALACYFREARGTSASRRVFLRHIAPRVGLSGPHAVSVVARDAVQRAGLMPAGRVGAHIFRHSMATQMIRRGATLEEISQILRHRTIKTTQLYAKVEFELLRDVALPWPSAEVLR